MFYVVCFANRLVMIGMTFFQMDVFYLLEVWKDTAAVIYTDDFNFGTETAELVRLDVTDAVDVLPLAEMPM